MARHFIMEGKSISENVMIIDNGDCREKTLEFIRSCLETETVAIGILVSREFEVRILERDL